MALPAQGEAWPPKEWAPAFGQYRLNDALYTGDVDDLHEMFTGADGGGGYARGDSDAYHYNKGNGNTGLVRRMIDTFRSWFWSSSSKAGQTVTRLHSPLAGNLATLSADVLLSEPPSIRFIGADGEPMKGKEADRLDDLVGDPATRATLQQAAEYCAGLSAVALTVNWNNAVTEKPWLQVVGCDAVIPEWEDGQLSAVNLWTMHPITNAGGFATGAYYHVERHEKGRIVHALYLGTLESIGNMVPISDLPATARIGLIPGSLAEGLTVVLPTGTDKLTATFWINLPTRKLRKDAALARIGRADTEGVEHFIDQVDMVWSSWMRDIKLARARIIVSSSLLDQGANGAPQFDDDAEIIKSLNFTPTGPDDPPLTMQQFAIRANEHAASILELTKEVLNHCGYSLASYGEYGDVQKTATEVTDRKNATERTRDKKALYFLQAVTPLLEAYLDIDRIQYGQPGMPATAVLDITFPEISQIDPEAQARTFSAYRTAMVASTKTMVAALHPDWDSDQIDTEVKDILKENAVALGEEVDPAIAGRDGVAPGEDSPEGDDEDAGRDPAASEGAPKRAPQGAAA